MLPEDCLHEDSDTFVPGCESFSCKSCGATFEVCPGCTNATGGSGSPVYHSRPLCPVNERSEEDNFQLAGVDESPVGRAFRKEMAGRRYGVSAIIQRVGLVPRWLARVRYFRQLVASLPEVSDIKFTSGAPSATERVDTSLRKA